MVEEKEKLWLKTARTIIKAGQMPVPISEPLLTLIKTIILNSCFEFSEKMHPSTFGFF